MNGNRISFIKISKEAAGRHLMRTAGALLCVILTGCSGTDKALDLELGEPVEHVGATSDSGASYVDAPEATEVAGRELSGVQESGEEPSLLYVYVCGAVQAPGVVVLPEGSRCNDALEAAGGLREDAAGEAVNLAKLVSDGEQIYFPTAEEARELAEAEQAAEAGLVNINTAGVELLCTLPGIGEAKAKAIVAYREQNGSFRLAEDIMQVPGIKESAYSRMKALITVQ